ncbi:MAG: hypothetical protein DRJ10_07270 [Bacteroidetes bacterium]|nr:MAG: hypothetical protein DRJ10_07270 [Bacteroidota bacterium]
MRFAKVLLLILLLFVVLQKSHSQTPEIDSLINTLYSNIDDTTFVQNAIKLSWSLMYVDTDTAIYYGNLAVEKSLTGKHLLNIVNAYNVRGVCSIVKSEYNEALSYLKKGEETGFLLLKEQPNKKINIHRMGAIYSNMGNVYSYKGNYDIAIKNYMHALNMFKEINLENVIGICSSNIAICFGDLQKFDKALEYNFIALEIAERTEDIFSLTQSLNNIGSIYFNIEQYDSAYKYVSKSAKLSENNVSENDLIDINANLGSILHKLHQYDSALVYFSKAREYSVTNDSRDGLVNIHYMIAQMYNDMMLYDSAIFHYEKSKILAEQTGTGKFIMFTNERLADIYYKEGKYKLAYEDLLSGSNMRDSIFSEESDVRIANMEVKYQSEIKEEEIKLLQETAKLNQATAKTNKIVFSAIIIILILIIVMVILAYRSYKHKQLAERRKIQQNAERKILDAVIETEYKERKRFAEDLHDGLGVLLSTTRLYINEIEDSNIEDRKSLIKQSNSMLDDAIANARNISNNIMPAALKNNGLEIAIRSFSDKINSSGNLKIDVQSVNFKKHYKSTIEITIYRILTEMINNTIKHAEATLVNISLIEKNKTLLVTYYDNGKGFDYDAMIKSSEKGMGLDNTISRINSISGTCSINSKVGEGFFAKIEVSTNNI